MRGVSDPFGYFGVGRDFGLIGMPCVDLVKRVTLDWPWLNRAPLRLFAHLLQLGTFSVSALGLVPRLRPDVLYSRDLLPLTLIRLFTRRPCIHCFEAHTTPRSRLSRRLHLWAVRQMDRIVVISDGLRRWYLEHGLPPDRVLTARDAVSLRAFEGLSRKEAREALGIGPDTPTVCYLGHLYPWKGVDVLLQAAPRLDPEVRIYVVGGMAPDLDRIAEGARDLPNVEVTGHLPPQQARRYLVACDLAVMPFTGRTAIAREHTSPLKLFEYMAAGCAIVASDLPSLREVLVDGHNAVLVPPDDPAALAAGITRVLRDHELTARIQRAARAEVEEHTWTRRAASVLDFLKPRSPA
jgi:glycosyltransferase involved in cell wall biosynthesis